MKSSEKRKKIVSKKRFSNWLSNQYKAHQGATVTYLTLRALVILIMISSIINNRWENTLMCALSLVLFFIPSLVEENLKIEVPDLLESIILLFIFSAEILGEIAAFYVYIPHWDTMLHTLNGFIAAAVGLSLIDLLNRTERFHFDLSPFFLALFAFCFSMTIGVFWEFAEFFMDFFFATDMQKDTIIYNLNSILLSKTGGNVVDSINNIHSVVIDGVALPFEGYIDIGIIDTMKDLFVNFIGAFVFSSFGYFYEKDKGKRNSWINELMPVKMDEKRIKELDELHSKKK